MSEPKAPPKSEPARVHRYVSNDFTLRISAVNATEVVKEMQQLQDTRPIPTIAAGRTMVGSLLLASQLKQGLHLGLYIRSNGPIPAVYAEASFEGQVRAYTPTPLWEPEDYSKGLSLQEAFANGSGTLTVVRHQPFEKQPFHGMVHLKTGEIGEDIAHYLYQSHQIRSLVSLGVYVDVYGKVRSAGGVIIEVMPGVEESVVDLVQKNSEDQKESISKLIMEGVSETELVRPYLKGIPFTELDHPYPISYSCPCTRERLLAALEILGIEELEDMLQKKEEAEVTCQVCGRPYTITLPELKEMKDRLYRNTLN